MTKLDIVNQLMDLSVAGYFNGTKFTKSQFDNYIGKMCSNDGDKLYMRIALPDGEWLFKIVRYTEGDWDYFIPDTRDEEQKLVSEFMSKVSRVRA